MAIEMNTNSINNTGCSVCEQAKRITLPLLQVRSEERNTTNMITAIQTENCSQRLPNHWRNAENVGMNGYLKSRSNTDGRFFRPLLFP